MNDIVRKALEEAATKGELSKDVTSSEEFKALSASKEAPKEKKEVLARPAKAESPVDVLTTLKQRTEPIWPMDDEQKAQWRKSLAERKPKPPVEVTQERLEEIRRLATEAAQQAYARIRPTETPVVKQKVEKVKVSKAAGRQSRLGQTKLIDDLIKQGRSETEILTIVKEKIPAYPADKLPKLIKLRQYHSKKK